MRWLGCCVALSLVHLATGDRMTGQNDDMNYNLGMLYEDPGDQVDPHDMLAYPSEERGPRGAGLMGDEEQGKEINKKRNLEADQGQLKFMRTQLLHCKALVSQLEKSVKLEQQKSSLMQKKLATESPIDMQAFYTRLIHHLWNIMELEEAWNILKDDSTSLLRHLTVHVTRNDLDALHGFLQHSQHIHQVDQFVERSFILDEAPDDFEVSLIQAFFTLVLKGLEVGKNVEVWLYILCMGFLLLACWAVLLFIRDIHRELRWGQILKMMVVLVFIICCLWHWRHMHKLAESKRHAQMVKRGFRDLPEECKPGGRGTAGSIFEWIKFNVFFAPDVCEKYFEEVMIDPTEEITPAMVIAETLAKFCLQPLQHIGSEVAKLITNFYGNVPPIYHVPATIVFLVLLVVVLFYAFGYGIDFPLWLGGIRPIYRTNVADTNEVDRITREAVAQLNQDRERFLEESRNILADITQAASVVQGQRDLQPLMFMSSHILENQLEQLISRHLGTVLNQESVSGLQRRLPESLPLPDSPELITSSAVSASRNHRAVLEHRKIHTVTSTPLHTSSETAECSGEGMCLRTRNVQGCERNCVSENKDQSTDAIVEVGKGVAEQNIEGCLEQEGTTEVDSGSMSYRVGHSPVYKSSNRQVGLAASTDGVHHRIQGLPKSKILPPKRTSIDGGSTGSLEDRREERLSRKERRKHLEKGKLGHSEGDLDEGEGWRGRLGRLGRKFHSTNSVDREPSPSSCSTNTNTSTQSLFQDLSARHPSESDHEVIDRPGTSGVTRLSNMDTSRSDAYPDSSSTSGEFFFQVKSLLEESVNSSQNESQTEVTSSCPETLQRTNQDGQSEEVELSAYGSRFLKSMKALDTDDSI